MVVPSRGRDAPSSRDSEKLFFHAEGVETPEEPRILTLPESDVPLMRLARPPGDESLAFITETWAEEIETVGYRPSAKDGFGD